MKNMKQILIDLINAECKKTFNKPNTFVNYAELYYEPIDNIIETFLYNNEQSDEKELLQFFGHLISLRLLFLEEKTDDETNFYEWMKDDD